MLFFKKVEQSQLDDPGPQLTKVIEFKRQIESEKKYWFNSYAETEGFGEKLERYLARWLLDHERTANAPASGGLITSTPPDVPASVTPVVSKPSGPDFDYWIGEANQLINAETPNNFGALFCAERAEAAAGSEIQWARAKNSLGVVRFHLNNLNESLATFREIGKRFDSASEVDKQIWQAVALYNEGLTLGRLGRNEEAIAVYDNVITFFGSAPESSLREMVTEALAAKEGNKIRLKKKRKK